MRINGLTISLPYYHQKKARSFMSEPSRNTSAGDMFHRIPPWQSHETQSPDQSYMLPLEMETQHIQDIQTLPEKPGREDGVDDRVEREEKNLLEITRPEFEVTSAFTRLRCVFIEWPVDEYFASILARVADHPTDPIGLNTLLLLPQ
jgi:hypothetical protein